MPKSSKPTIGRASACCKEWFRILFSAPDSWRVTAPPARASARDLLWTSLALDAAGDFANTKTAIEFVSKYQREDGKMPHEIAQGASFVPWFKDFPYGYASADSTPLYIIAMNDYVTESGDVAFAKEKWDSVWKAYQFLHSTYDEQGFPKNFGVGHGWVEGGPLLPVESEFYQSGLGAEALRTISNLAH